MLLNKRNRAADSKIFEPSLFKPLLPDQKFSFIAVEELEIARQLTLIDFVKLQSIQPREFLGQVYTSHTAYHRACHRAITRLSQGAELLPDCLGLAMTV